MATDGNWLPAWLNTRKVRRFAPVCHGDLLDIGCGSKPYESILGPRVQRYVGFDHPDTVHDRASVDVWGDAAELPFPDASFDTVVLFHVLEHTEAPERVVAEVERVLRPGGAVVLAMPFMWGLHEAPRDFFRLTSFGIEHVLAGAGLTEVHVEPVAGTLGTLGMRASYFTLRVAGQLPSGARAAAPLVAGIQLAALVLDRLYRDYTDATGYFAVARKPG
jgi:SAM-dependent methyltransferase